MEGPRKRPLYWAILLLGSAAFVFHMVGFIAPGWIIVGLKPQPFDWIGNLEELLGEGGGIRGGGRFEGGDISGETDRTHPRHNFTTTEAPTWLWRKKRQTVDFIILLLYLIFIAPLSYIHTFKSALHKYMLTHPQTQKQT